MTQLAQLCLVGDFAAARAVQRKYLPLMEVNFIESNPIPVKAAMVFWRLEGSAWPLQRAASTEPGVSPIQVLLVRSEQSGRSLPHDRRQQPLGPVSVLAAPKRRSGRSLLVSPFIPANPSMRSSVGRSPQCSMDRLHFFLFVRVVSPEGAPKIPVWPEPGSWHSVGTKTPCCPQFYCAEWSFVVLSASPRHRTGLGTDQPVKSPSRQLDARRASLIC